MGCNISLFNAAGQTGRDLAQQRESPCVLAQLDSLDAEFREAKGRTCLVSMSSRGDTKAMLAPLDGGDDIDQAWGE